MDEVLSTGYLSEAEAAYQRGEISDYFLFPTGKLQRGAYVPLCRATDKPLSDHTLREKFGELEAIAGVEHRKGRAFYGLRRQATDLAPEFAQDAQVLNRISGHSDSATRERIYQDPQNERVRARAAEARRNMRALAAVTRSQRSQRSSLPARRPSSSRILKKRCLTQVSRVNRVEFVLC